MDINAYPKRSRRVIQAAQTDALTRGHQQLTPLHIFSALLNEDGGLPRNLLTQAGADMQGLDGALETALNKRPRVEGGSGLSLSNAAAKIFAHVEKAAKSAGDAFVTLERLLLACVIHADKELQGVLTAGGVNKDPLINAIKSVRRDAPVTSDAAEDQYEARSLAAMMKSAAPCKF